MPISEYLKALRSRVGTDLLLVPSVAAVIRDDHGRVLLQLRAVDGLWSLPGGAIDPGESPARAVVREVWEETGLRVRPIRILAVLGGEGFRHTYDNGDVVEYTITMFEVGIVGGELGGRDDETADLVWFDPQAIPPLSLRYPSHLFRSGLDERAFFTWDEAWLDDETNDG